MDKKAARKKGKRTSKLVLVGLGKRGKIDPKLIRKAVVEVREAQDQQTKAANGANEERPSSQGGQTVPKKPARKKPKRPPQLPIYRLDKPGKIDPELMRQAVAEVKRLDPPPPRF